VAGNVLLTWCRRRPNRAYYREPQPRRENFYQEYGLITPKTIICGPETWIHPHFYQIARLLILLTLTFVGVEKYIENVGNLVPVVNFLLGDEQSSRSDLMSITLNEEEKYVETRWYVYHKSIGLLARMA
jgi:hypothetical protein